MKLKECLDANPGIRGIMLGSHGLFTWGNTAYDSYINTLEVIETCARYLEDQTRKQKNIFGGPRMKAVAKNERLQQACGPGTIVYGDSVLPKRKMIGHFTDDDRVLEFINSNDLETTGADGNQLS